ncbi:MAG: putative DNA-binding domain-containing protein [Pseudomonadota bacterium]
MTDEQLQRAFAARIRQPEAQALLPGVPEARMAIYQSLFFNNVEGFISGAFPVLRTLFDELRWQGLVRAFLAGHRCTTPYFLQISQEFLAWLQQGYAAQADDPPFMLELAHYEWVELALDVSEAEHPDQGWSPLAWPLAYRWPVQRIGQRYQPVLAPEAPTCLLVWRDPRDKVRFMLLAPFAYQLAVRLQAGDTAVAALQGLALGHGLAFDPTYLANARAVLDDWQRQGIWFGEADSSPT